MNDSLNQLRAKVDAARATHESAKAAWLDKKAAAIAAHVLATTEKNEHALGIAGPRPAPGFKLPKSPNELAAEAASAALDGAELGMNAALRDLSAAESKLLRAENAITTHAADQRAREILEPFYNARAAAHARLNRASDAVTRAKRFAAAAADHLKSLEQRAEQSEAKTASWMANLIATVGLDSVFPPPDQNDEQFASELTAARRDHSVKAKALTTLEAARTAAQTQVAQAESAVATAVGQLLDDESTERANAVSRLLDEAQRLGTELKYFAVAAQVNGDSVPASTRHVLNRLDLPLINIMTTAINLAQTGEFPAYRVWLERRAEMMAGTIAAEEPKAA